MAPGQATENRSTCTHSRSVLHGLLFFLQRQGRAEGPSAEWIAPITSA